MSTHQDVSTGTQEAEIGGPALDLLAVLVQKNVDDYAATSNALIENYKSQAEEAQATLDAIRWKIDDLLNGEFMPTPGAILRALWPNERVIQSYMPEHES